MVLARDKYTVVKDLHELMETLLDLNLVPLNSNARVGDGKSLLFFGGLDFDLENSLLEESDVEVQMGSPKVNIVLHVVFVLVQVKLGMDGVFVDGQRVWNHIVSGHQVV